MTRPTHYVTEQMAKEHGGYHRALTLLNRGAIPFRSGMADWLAARGLDRSGRKV